MDPARSAQVAHGPARRGCVTASDLVLPSRAEAMNLCRAAIEAGMGPVLITGAAGVGKTWLWRKLAESLPAQVRIAAVDLAPSDRPADLVRGVLHRLGLSRDRAEAGDRLELADELARRTQEGERWMLALDEAQNGSDLVLEEFRLLANRLGHEDGFDSLLLVGQSGLAHRLKGRELEGLRSRIGAHAILNPLDFGEAGAFLRAARPSADHAPDQIDHWHRRAQGNPRRLLLLTQSPATPQLPTVQPRARAGSAPNRPTLGLASKPPLRVEDGLIEVGWSQADEPALPPHDPADAAAPTLPEIEAALPPDDPARESWHDWVEDEATRESDEAEALIDAQAQAEGARESSPDAPGSAGREDATQLRAEPQHGFAPYGPLFSRLRPAHDAE